MQEKLILLRKRENITQQFFAELIGISSNQYSLKENGRYEFNCDEMFKISEYLKIPIEDIFLPTSHRNGVNSSK